MSTRWTTSGGPRLWFIRPCGEIKMKNIIAAGIDRGHYKEYPGRAWIDYICQNTNDGHLSVHKIALPDMAAAESELKFIINNNPSCKIIEAHF